MIPICNINEKIYECVSKEFLSDEVIITDERIKHIKEHRGIEFYEFYKNYFAEILDDPDYIFPDSKNTVLVCKNFPDNQKYINLVLRIAVPSDYPSYKNSIITAIGEGYKRFHQRLRNNDFLYKKESLE